MQRTGIILGAVVAVLQLTAFGGVGFFGAHPNRTVEFGAESPRAAGKASVDGETLTIGYDFSQGGRTVAVCCDLPDRPTVESIALDMNYGVDVRLAVRLTDSGGQVFRRMFGILGSEWEHAALNLSDEGWTFSGGPQDGVFRQPAVKVEFVAESAFFESAGMAGRLQVRNVTLSAKPVASDAGMFPPPLQDVSYEAAIRLASNAYARLNVLVPELEAKGVGAKSRATLCVLEKFFGWVALDLRKGLTRRALDEAREMAAIGRRGVSRAEEILAGRAPDFPVPRYQTGAIDISHAQAIVDRRWPDGRVDRGPVFFNGFGHFTLAKNDFMRFPELGCSLLQFEIRPCWLMPSETQVASWVLDEAVQTLERAASNGVAVSLLLSPHGWPEWTYKKWPHLKDCSCYGGFCPYDKDALAVIERYLRLVIPRIRGNRALHSVCLTNEPWTGCFDKCPRLRKLWIGWLRRKYGTLAELKARLGVDLASFEDATVPPITTDGNPAPVLAEFIRFNRTCLADWHRWMADVVHGMAPELPVHSKIQVYPIQWQSHVFYSVDPVQFGKFCQYNGNDAVDFFMPKDYWAHNWWGMEIGYDLQRSAADVPVVNTENHLHPDRSHGTYMPGAHTYAALWQGALHGQNGSALWCWERAYDDGKLDFNGLVLNRPECLEAYAHCALDLSRLADRIAPLQNLPPSVLVLYSTDYLLRGGAHALGITYRAASFLGQPLGVVSEEMVADCATGELKRPFDSAKAILLPDVKGAALPEAVLQGLARFKAAGGDVLEMGALSEAEQHRLLAQKAVQWGLPDHPVARDPETGLPAFGVETRGVTQGGVSLISLCNHTSHPIHVKLAKCGVDLITGGNVADELVLRPLAPRLIEYAADAPLAGNRAKRTLFLGDSITHFGYCLYYLQLFENLRHPGSDARYCNVGHSGGRVCVGRENYGYERPRINPDRVFVMFGMNDVDWTAFETNAVMSAARKSAADASLELYRKDYRALADEIRASGVTNAVFVTPTPYDEYSLVAPSPRRRNVTEYALKRAAQIVGEVAAEKGASVVDLTGPMSRLCAAHPDRSFCGGDRVHPPRIGHLFMACQFLAALGEDAPVADVRVTAEGKVEKCENAAVRGLVAKNDSVVFDYCPKALPWPDLVEYRELVKFCPDLRRFNRETLAVSGLAAGRWRVLADGRELATVTADELGRGIDLADLDTPGRRAAATVMPAFERLHDFDQVRRDRACVRGLFLSFGVDMTDKAALKAAGDKYLADIKAKGYPWYGWQKQAFAKFLDAVGREKEIAAAEDCLYRALAAVRPVAWRLSVVRCP